MAILFAVGGLALMLMRRSSKPLFAATRLQLWPRRTLEIEVDDGSPPLDTSELEVTTAMMAANIEYQRLRKSLSRRLGSLRIIGGVPKIGRKSSAQSKC